MLRTLHHAHRIGGAILFDGTVSIPTEQLYTTNASAPQTNVSRTLPLQAVLSGVSVGGTNNLATSIAGAIEAYIRTNGPLRIPAEICNVPEIAARRAAINPTRNDFVRQIVGTLRTQDNVFSVWTVGQAIQKRRGSTDYGNFESGDSVLAEVRLHFIVERYFDPARMVFTEISPIQEQTPSSEI